MGTHMIECLVDPKLQVLHTTVLLPYAAFTAFDIPPADYALEALLLVDNPLTKSELGFDPILRHCGCRLTTCCLQLVELISDLCSIGVPIRNKHADRIEAAQYLSSSNGCKFACICVGERAWGGEMDASVGNMRQGGPRSPRESTREVLNMKMRL